MVSRRGLTHLMARVRAVAAGRGAAAVVSLGLVAEGLASCSDASDAAAAAAGNGGSAAQSSTYSGGARDSEFCDHGRVRPISGPQPQLFKCDEFSSGVQCVNSGACPSRVGAYDLRVVSVRALGDAPPGDAPSVGQRMRVDVRATPVESRLLVTPMFGTPTQMSDTSHPTAQVLEFERSFPGGRTVDEWKQLDPWGGSIYGTQRTYFDDGTTTEREIVGTGAVGKDATAPTLTAAWTSLCGPVDAVLPWDPVVVRASEPLSPGAMESAFRISAAGATGASTAFTGIIAPTESLSWAGVVEARLSLVDWGAAGGSWVAASTGKLADSTGNLATSASVTASMLPVPLSAPGAPGMASVASWGSAVFYPAGTSACESGSCAQLIADPCSVTRSGLALRLMAKAGGSVTVRYRIWAKSAELSSSPLGLQVARHNGPDTTAAAPQPTLSAQATPLDGFGFAGDWATLAAPTVAAGEVGVVIHASTPSVCGAPSAQAVLVVVDAIGVP